MGESTEQLKSPCIQFDVFRYVRASQAQYGLKHADYKRYRCDDGTAATSKNCSLDLDVFYDNRGARCGGVQAALPEQVEQAAWTPQVPSWPKQVPKERAQS